MLSDDDREFLASLVNRLVASQIAGTALAKIGQINADQAMVEYLTALDRVEKAHGRK